MPLDYFQATTYTEINIKTLSPAEILETANNLGIPNFEPKLQSFLENIETAICKLVSEPIVYDSVIVSYKDFYMINKTRMFYFISFTETRLILARKKTEDYIQTPGHTCLILYRNSKRKYNDLLYKKYELSPSKLPILVNHKYSGVRMLVQAKLEGLL